MTIKDSRDLALEDYSCMVPAVPNVFNLKSYNVMYLSFLPVSCYLQPGSS